MKGQVTIEFMALVSFSIIIIIVFMIIFNQKHNDIIDEKRYTLSNDLAYNIQKEIIIAHDANQGYSRQFFIPDTLDGINYSITNTNNTFNIDYSTGNIPMIIPETIGSIKKGYNNISKIEGIVCINC